MSGKDRTLKMKLPEQLYNELQQVAERKYISLASLVRMACAEWLEANNDGKPDIEALFRSLPGEVVLVGSNVDDNHFESFHNEIDADDAEGW